MRISRVLVGVGSFCLLLSGAKANTIITDPGPASMAWVSFAGGGVVTLGYDFAVNGSLLQLNALGVWDENSDGLQNAHFVGIWNSNGDLLGQATIAAGTA